MPKMYVTHKEMAFYGVNSAFLLHLNNFRAQKKEAFFIFFPNPTLTDIIPKNKVYEYKCTK